MGCVRLLTPACCGLGLEVDEGRTVRRVIAHVGLFMLCRSAGLLFVQCVSTGGDRLRADGFGWEIGRNLTRDYARNVIFQFHHPRFPVHQDGDFSICNDRLAGYRLFAPCRRALGDFCIRCNALLRD